MTSFPADPATPRTPSNQIAEALQAPGFGKYFVDHCARAVWTSGQGWHDRTLVATAAFSVHPGLAALHYGQEIFEGLKAYRHADGSIWLFRPRRNAARFARSAERMSMPVLPEDDFLDAVRQVVGLNAEWVPEPGGEQSLYIRPFMFASETLLGVRAAHEYTFMVLATPVDPYYPDPLTLWVSPTFSRSMGGGTGEAKCGGNYAAAMAGEAEANAHGCGQVLWLDSATRSWIEEGGTMNFFCITAENQLVTPDLNGNILPGITRDSILHLAHEHGLTPVERPLALAEVLTGSGDGQIVEAFACGTAAVVSPVVGIRTSEVSVPIGDGSPGRLTSAIRAHLTGIQYGTVPDSSGWLERVC